MPMVHDVIASRQNQHIVKLVKLSDRKHREEMRLFRFDGVKLLCEAIKREVPLDSVFVRAGSEERLDARMGELYGLSMKDLDCDVFRVSEDLFDRISEEKSPDGVISVANYIDKFHKMIKIEDGNLQWPTDQPTLLLESVRDPSNVGAILRSAAALGVTHVILSEDCADLYHSKTVRATMGTMFSMPLCRVSDMPAAVRFLRGRGQRVFASTLNDHSVSLDEVTFAPGDCVVIGNEGHGLSEDTVDACGQTVYIPMQADVESLNASVAAALLMWELGRARPQ